MWDVKLTKHAAKQLDKLPLTIQNNVLFLMHEIVESGPLRYSWKNFGKLRGTESHYHCHIKSGKPTYVVCWEVKNKKIQIVEVYYVGTHEKAPY